MTDWKTTLGKWLCEAGVKRYGGGRCAHCVRSEDVFEHEGRKVALCGTHMNEFIRTGGIVLHDGKLLLNAERAKAHRAELLRASNERADKARIAHVRAAYDTIARDLGVSVEELNVAIQRWLASKVKVG